MRPTLKCPYVNARSGPNKDGKTGSVSMNEPADGDFTIHKCKWSDSEPKKEESSLGSIPGDGGEVVDDSEPAVPLPEDLQCEAPAGLE